MHTKDGAAEQRGECIALSIYHLDAVNLFVGGVRHTGRRGDKVFEFQFHWVVFAFPVKIVMEAAPLLPSPINCFFRLPVQWACSLRARHYECVLSLLFSLFLSTWLRIVARTRTRDIPPNDRRQKMHLIEKGEKEKRIFTIQIHSICSNIEHGRPRSWRTPSGAARTSHSYTSLLQYVSDIHIRVLPSDLHWEHRSNATNFPVFFSFKPISFQVECCCPPGWWLCWWPSRKSSSASSYTLFWSNWCCQRYTPLTKRINRPKWKKLPNPSFIIPCPRHDLVSKYIVFCQLEGKIKMQFSDLSCLFFDFYKNNM